MNIASFLNDLDRSPDATMHLMLPTGEFVPAHFHVTEVGRVQKDFMDCGGTIRSSTTCVLQVWVADDSDHRLITSNLAKIIRLAAKILKTTDLPVEVEYEHGLISQFPLAAVEVTPAGLLLHLGSKHTDCLAQSQCGVPTSDAACCTTAGCC